jgi:hypothetical protein
MADGSGEALADGAAARLGLGVGVETELPTDGAGEAGLSVPCADGAQAAARPTRRAAAARSVVRGIRIDPCWCADDAARSVTSR